MSIWRRKTGTTICVGKPIARSQETVGEAAKEIAMIKTGSIPVLRRKATFLRNAAQRLESNRNSYSWRDASRCNVGVLAQAVLGTDSRGVRLRLKGFRWNVAWKYLANIAPHEPVCQTANLPIGQMFHALRHAGFHLNELVDLETLNDPAIRAFSGWGKFIAIPEVYKDSDAVVQYLRNWAALIDKELERRKKRSHATA
jgi:hypothetical protein